jgi:putative endonuclease
MGAFVYMLRCADRSFYVGSATAEDLTMRIAQHQAGTFEISRRETARGETSS